MNKQTRIAVICLSSFLLTCSYFVFAEDQITITTYYPSPYGSYNKLQTNRLAVGDTSGDGSLSSADQPPADGQIYTSRSVIYKPQSSLPASDVMQGELAYKSSDKSLYLYDGSGWVKQGGGVSYTHYCFNSSAYGTPVCADAGGSQGYCPSGYTQKLALGSWGYCGGYVGGFGCIASNFFLPPGGSCGTGFNCGGPVAGQAYVCSQ